MQVVHTITKVSGCAMQSHLVTLIINLEKEEDNIFEEIFGATKGMLKTLKKIFKDSCKNRHRYVSVATETYRTVVIIYLIK